jgi:hypothetical protein
MHPHLRSIFSKGHIAPPMQSVFNRPVLAIQCQQALGIRFVSGQIGQARDDLLGMQDGQASRLLIVFAVDGKLIEDDATFALIQGQQMDSRLIVSPMFERSTHDFPIDCRMRQLLTALRLG